MNWRRNWRIYVLVVLVLISGLALLVPAGGSSPGTATDGNATTNVQNTTTDDGVTNLQFGLELSGGARLRANLVGLVAEDVAVSPGERSSLEQTVAENLGTDPINVTVRSTSQTIGTVEVFSGEISQSEFREALEASGADVSAISIRNDVTDATWDSAVEILRNKINQGGLTGGTVTLITTPTGEKFLVVSVPNADRSTVVDLVGDQGQVQIIARYPVESDNGTVYEETQVLAGDDLTGISPAQEGEGRNPPYVSVTVQEGEAAQRYAEVMNQRGFTSEGVSNCRWSENNTEDTGYCLKTVVDGETVYAAGVAPDLADSIRSGEWIQTRGFRLQTNDYNDAQELQIHLQAGSLPTALDIQSQTGVDATLGQRVIPLSLVTGIVAWLTVAGVIFYRYREVRIAVPMLLTAFAEVWILLGFAAAVGLALDPSHIAGLIAVIGTGVDDLVIIADEIMQRGEIATDRVFKNRFRKAFWVIGAAAITTIIAMSPLAVLSLGDLQGFAIVTIVGVLIGVLITRPAYGDILRNLLLSDRE